jgi:myo-inositol 2-dehydrogenase/D-chiro-inositol 1-dehydrogenase
MRIGIYGTGQMGLTHARTFAGLDGVTVAGVADVDERRVMAAAAAVGATPCADLGALLDLRLDAVVVAVPNVLHARTTLAALERGVHVFCEKPIATTLDDARRVREAVGRTGLVYQMGFNRRFAPAYAGMRELIGTMKVFSGTIKMNDGDMRTPAWFTDPAVSGGFMYDTAIHLFDMALWQLGPVDEVQCRARSSCYPDLDDAVALLHFRSGVIAVFSTCGHATWTAPTERVEFYGDHQAVATEGFERLTFTAGLGQPAVTRDFSALPAPERLGYAQEDRAFVDAVAGRRPPAVSVDDAYRAVELVDACYRSASAGGAMVRLP